MKYNLAGHSPLHDAACALLSYPRTPSLHMKRSVDADSPAMRAIRVSLAGWIMKAVDGRMIINTVRERYDIDSLLRLPTTKAKKDAASAARQTLFRDGRSLDLKLIYLRLILNYVTDERIVRRVMSRAGFAACEAQTYIDLVNDEKLWAGVRNHLKTSFSDKKIRNELTLSPAEIRQQAQEDFSHHNLRKQAVKQANHKLRFIARSNNIEIDDLAQDLLVRAMSWYYVARPFKTRLHSVNYARAAISSGVQEIIEVWTKEDVARLRETRTGWESVVVSLDALASGLGNSKILSTTSFDDDHLSVAGSGCLSSTLALA